MRAFVDVDHAGDSTTRRSRAGFPIYLNFSLTYFISKKQTTVETSSFGSEFIAIKQCCEYIRGLRYKLRIMGILVSNPTFIVGDNQSVLWNKTKPNSMLKKKSNSIAYHFVRENTARNEQIMSYMSIALNPLDILTKALKGGENRKRKAESMLYNLYPGE